MTQFAKGKSNQTFIYIKTNILITVWRRKLGEKRGGNYWRLGQSPKIILRINILLRIRLGLTLQDGWVFSL